MKHGPVHQQAANHNTPDYRHVFVVRVHQLIKLGYDRLNPTDHREMDEPALTGVLVEEIKATLRDPPTDIETWSDYFHVADDPPENTEGRTGKRRRRVDLFIESGWRPRQGFRFEAKRLRNKKSVADYLGDDGLGRFISGAYGPSDLDAGMLGYVQSEDAPTWIERISDALSSAEYSALNVDAKGCETVEWPTEVGPTIRSRHFRTVSQDSLIVYHTFLRFC